MSVIISFDWDDTLLATTQLTFMSTKTKQDTITMEVVHQDYTHLRRIDAVACSVLKTASRYGLILIITNAETIWVEATGRRYLPETLKFINDTKIQIVSAAEMYKERLQTHSLWKYFTMLDIFKTYNNVRLFVSIGDSCYEKSAALKIEGESFHDTSLPRVIKTIKMVDSPTFQQLTRQLLHIKAILPSYINGEIYDRHSVLALQILTKSVEGELNSKTFSQPHKERCQPFQ